MSSLAKRNYLSELRELNWDFTGEAGSDGFAGYHWYPARFVPQVPGILMGYFSEPSEIILDPFCGSGTTHVEAARLGRRSIGIDTNPIAVLMTAAKLIHYDDSLFSEYMEAVVGAAEARLPSLFHEQSFISNLELIPNAAENATWYDDATLRELAAVWLAIEETESHLKLVGRAAFSSILRFCCSQEKHWGWICDNVKPTQLQYRPAKELFSRKLQDFGIAAKELRRQRAAAGFPDMDFTSDHSLWTGPCAEVLREAPTESVDLVVTSPPYFSVTDYVRSQRLSFLWYDLGFNDSRRTETGARYRRHRQAALAEYLQDLRRSLGEIVRVLKPGRVCALVLGESPSRTPYLPQVSAMLTELDVSIEASLERRLPKRRSMTSRQFTEQIVIGRKKGDGAK
jgi:DNA modification methylase